MQQMEAQATNGLEKKLAGLYQSCQITTGKGKYIMSSNVDHTPGDQHPQTQWSYRAGLVLRQARHTESIRAGPVLMKVGSHTQAGRQPGLVLRQVGHTGSVGAGPVLMKVGSNTQQPGLALRQVGHTGNVGAGPVLMKVGSNTQQPGLALRQVGHTGSVGAGPVLMKVGSYTQAGRQQGLLVRQVHGLKDPGLLVVT
jgi:hypothetical protein